MSIQTPLLSIVTPAYNEAAGLPQMYEEIKAAVRGVSFEWIIVDDHSVDGTFEVASKLAAADSRIYAVRLARNSGSHVALFCGLEQACGDCAVTLVADLQDPRALFSICSTSGAQEPKSSGQCGTGRPRTRHSIGSPAHSTIA